MEVMEAPPPPILPKLNIKYQAFADAYVQTKNATKSAIIAGYTPKNADNAGWRLMKNADVKRYIEGKLHEIAEKMYFTPEGIKTLWNDVMKSSAVKVDSKLKASELMAKTMPGLFKDNERVGDTFNIFASLVPTERVRSGKQTIIEVEGKVIPSTDVNDAKAS